MRFQIKTLGCKVNQSESEQLAYELAKRGLIETKESLEADLIIVNTCTVTRAADSKARQMVSRAIKSAKEKVIVTGCAVNNPKSGLDKFSEYADLIKQEEKTELSNKFSKPRGLVATVSRRCSAPRVDLRAVGSPPPSHPSAMYTSKRSRPFLKIQDGCNHSCSYCIVPSVRGPSKSLAYQSIIERACELLKQGYKELVLTGIDIGAYKDKGRNLGDLISGILALQGDFRLRLSSIEPQSLSPDFISYFSSERRICNHIHLPLQSGSNRLLRLMSRPYTREYIKELAKKLRRRRAGIALTTDIITGFPGESQKDFEETILLVNEISFSRIHIFPYSARPGTKAAGMENQISSFLKKERANQLKDLASKQSSRFKEAQVGKVAEVLIERKEDKYFKGTSSNYLTVYLPEGEGDGSLQGELVNVKIGNFEDGRLFGKIKV